MSSSCLPHHRIEMEAGLRGLGRTAFMMHRPLRYRQHLAEFSRKSLTVRCYSSWNPRQALKRFMSYKVTKGGVIAPSAYQEKTSTLGVLKEHVKESWNQMDSSAKIVLVDKIVKYAAVAASGSGSLVLVNKHKEKLDAAVGELAVAKGELKAMQAVINKLSEKTNKLEAEVKGLQIMNKMWMFKGFGTESNQDGETGKAGNSKQQ